MRPFAVLLLTVSAAFGQAPPMPAPFAAKTQPNPFAAVALTPVAASTMQIPQDSALPADGGLFPGPMAPPPPKLWAGSFEAGANGATGNTEILNVRFFADANRKTDTNLFHADMTYLLGKQNGITNQNTMILNTRDEVLFPGSPWSLYGTNYVDYDEQRDFKFYIGLYGGLGYLIADTDRMYFKVRGGAGALYKTGGPGDEWIPELNFGFDHRWAVGERGALLSNLDYFPSVEDFAQFRLRFRLAYEHTLDPASGLFFRTGLFERYDTNPGPGFQKSDLNYFITLGFNF